ncbi:hypothetical protein HYC85_023640 [Camellia sinensis]|uniref:Galectin n=1 Tax=Camellia sinensis TaxID=4442 RepID=A0A7J7GHI9_CAMSI|nr:hypothetical protein HYC85_023640 [Camellia sinensis]
MHEHISWNAWGQKAKSAYYTARVVANDVVVMSLGMKKWSGGLLILGLASILFLRYCFMGKKQPQKQSSYDFFNNHPPDDYDIIQDNDEVDSSQTTTKILQINVKKKPHLIDIKGLRDLYSPKNISSKESKAFLVCAQMCSLLSRSDALPETAQGIKEAAIAWKVLLSVIEKEKGSNGSVLQIPCGLVEDSSITVIGKPDGHRGTCQIKLVGSQFTEEATPPVILHYNVSMLRDNLTEEPVIVQNTWTNELGWGKKNYELQLMKCNEQVVRSTVEQNLNASHPDGDKLTNVSNGSAHVSANFPFVEGNPFTATLWVGLEGFHMTLNGRHETSLRYRKKLEPWLVSGVKVAGGLDLISTLAKGLLVSEDLDLIVDVEHLKASANFQEKT